MSSRSLLMVLIVLACFQSFRRAQNSNVPWPCCFTFVRYKIPLRLITDYEVTGLDCMDTGIMFIMKNGHRLCADPGVQWVQKHMAKIDQKKPGETMTPKNKVEVKNSQPGGSGSP